MSDGKIFMTEEFYDNLIGMCRHSGYLGMSWCVCDENGNKMDDNKVAPRRYICSENYYGTLVLWVDDNMVLAECEYINNYDEEDCDD